MKRHLQFSLYVNYAHVALSVSAYCGKWNLLLRNDFSGIGAEMSVAIEQAFRK